MSERPELPPVEIRAEVDALGSAVHRTLHAMLGAGRPPTDEELDALFAACDAHHRAALDTSSVLQIQCRRGCANCCTQMVFDVNAFEIDRIGRRLEDEGRAEAVRERVAARDARYRELKLENPRERSEADDDWVERVAIEFWKDDDACALLADDGSCSVHDIRPWSCRRTFAGNDPSLCRGEHAHDPRRRFFTLSPYETFDEELGALDHWAPFAVDSDRLDAGLLRWLDGRST